MIRLLCIGLGGMGHHDWNAAIDSGGFNPVGGVDVKEEARAVFAEKTGAPTFGSADKALAAVEADAVLVATPDEFHAPLAIQFLERGLDVICEKPMAESLEDGQRMHATAEANGRMLMIHQQLRWYPMHHCARRLIDEGAISGKIAKDVFAEMAQSGKPADQIVAERGLEQISDEDRLGELVEEAIANNPGAVKDFNSGKEKALGALVGYIMRQTKGQANPQLVNQMLREKLSQM